MKPQFRLMIGVGVRAEDDEVAFSLFPREGAICREPAQKRQESLGLIDQAVQMRNANKTPFNKVAFWDLEAETTLAAAIAAGAEVDRSICKDVARFSEYGPYRLMGVDSNPSADILKAYIQSVLSNTLLYDDYAERAAGFWFRTIHKPRMIMAWAKEYDTVNGLRCGMLQRKIKSGVTIVKSMRYPFWEINTDTFIWLKPVISNFCHMFIGTMKKETDFMESALEVFLEAESTLLRTYGKHDGGDDKWTLSDDRRWLKSPQSYVSMIGYEQVFEVIAGLLRLA